MSQSDNDKIKSLKSNAKNTYILHYACENLDPNVGHSPHIIAISVIGLAEETATTFSLQIEAEKQKISFDEISQNMDLLERKMLNSFFRFTEMNASATFVHWNMSDITYGFPAIYHRYSVLTGLVAPQIEARYLLDFASVLKSTYGRDYIEYPRLNNLIILNNLDSLDLYTGEEEARLIDNGEFIKATRSNIAKVKAMRQLLLLFLNEKLKVKEQNDKKGGFLSSLFKKK